MSNHNDSILDFYENKYNEDDRMLRHPLEYSRCKEIITRYLSNSTMEIADIGGATGAFSFWLAQMNHNVHLLDYVPTHVEKAIENGKKIKLTLASYVCGDARYVPYIDNQFDIVLEMGALYHLQNKDDRMSCLLEARRILKNSGIVICKVISRYVHLFEGFHRNLYDDETFINILDENLLTGRHLPGETAYFTTAYFHTYNEIANELVEAGFSDVSIIPVEGIGSAINSDDYFQNEKRKDLLLKYIRKTENIPELSGVSGHLMAIGKKV